MAKCKCCGGTVWSGVVLHSECYERMLQIWRPETETPPTAVEIWETDEGQEPFNISDDLIVKASDGRRGIARLHYTASERVWLTHDGTMIDVVGWMPIPE